MLSQIRNFLSWLTFSPQCLLCDEEIFVNNNLCSHCWSKLSFISENRCFNCGCPLSEDGNDLHKQLCNKKKNHYNKVRSSLVFDDLVAKLIYNFKYHDNTKAAATFSNWMFKCGEDILSSADFITPVPLHKNKLRMRKYNQSLILAQHIAKRANLKLIPDLLIRIEDTASQSNLSRLKRKQNVKSAFILKESYKELIIASNIVLVDDIITTGSTVNACARILKQRAHRVDVLTLAQTFVELY